MRIAWCTPFSPESAIGMVSQAAVEELALRDGVEVDVWHPATSGGRTWSGATHRLDLDRLEDLEEYDGVVYHLGDHAPNHLDLWKASLQVPGLVVLHDVVLRNLFHGYLLENGVYAEEFGRWYGAEAEARAAEALDSGFTDRRWLEEDLERYPFLSLATLGARHVLVHSRFAAGRVAEEVLADAAVVGLPVVPPAAAPPTPAAGVPDDRPVVLQAGMFNPNKRIDVVLAGFAELVHHRPAHLVLAGRGGQLGLDVVRRLVLESGVEDVTVVDNPSDATLAALRARADVGVVLREPCLEGASYAMLESLAAGVPLVVVDDGSYAEVTGNFVAHVPTPPQPADVARALGTLLDRDRTAVAGDARAFVAAQHTPASYADGVLRTLREGAGAGPRRRLVADLSAVLDAWGLAEIDGVIDTVAQRAAELFGADPVVPPVR